MEAKQPVNASLQWTRIQAKECHLFEVYDKNIFAKAVELAKMLERWSLKDVSALQMFNPNFCR